MNRRDAHLDAMLRHLGAAYYDSLHGKAAPADVARALDSVAAQVGEKPAGQPAAASSRAFRKSGKATLKVANTPCRPTPEGRTRAEGPVGARSRIRLVVNVSLLAPPDPVRHDPL